MKTLNFINYRQILVFLAIFIAVSRGQLSFAAFSAEEKGTSGAQFLKLGAGARAAAMGEAYSAVSSGADAVYWNPGALGRFNGVSGIFAHTDLFGELNYEYLGYAQSFKNIGSIGFNAQYLSVGRIPVTDTGGFETGDNMNPTQLALSLAYGREIGGFGIGAAAKYIKSRLAETSSTLAADVGVLSPGLINNKLRLAFVAQNVGGGLKYGQKSDPLPLNLKLGGAFSFSDKFILGLDVNSPRDNKPYAGVGAEYVFHYSAASFAGRLGYNSRTQGDVGGLTGLSTGLGAMFHNLALDYAFIPFGSLGNAHRISLTFKFGNDTAAQNSQPANTIDMLPIVETSTPTAVIISSSPPEQVAPPAPKLTFLTIITSTMTRQLVYMEAGVAVATETFDAAGALVMTEGAIPDGTYTEYYPDGVLKTIKSITAGKNNGILKAFFPTGTMEMEAFYQAGEKAGPLKYYTEQGVLLMEASYKNNLLNGWKKEYGSGGAVVSELYYTDGLPTEPPKP